MLQVLEILSHEWPRICWLYIVNTMAADALAISQGISSHGIDLPSIL